MCCTVLGETNSYIHGCDDPDGTEAASESPAFSSILEASGECDGVHAWVGMGRGGMRCSVAWWWGQDRTGRDGLGIPIPILILEGESSENVLE